MSRQGAIKYEYVPTSTEVKCPVCGKSAYGPGKDRTKKQVPANDERRAKCCTAMSGRFVHTPRQLDELQSGDWVSLDEIGDESDLRHLEDGMVEVCVDGQDVLVRPTEFEVLKKLE